MRCRLMNRKSRVVAAAVSRAEAAVVATDGDLRGPKVTPPVPRGRNPRPARRALKPVMRRVRHGRNARPVSRVPRRPGGRWRPHLKHPCVPMSRVVLLRPPERSPPTTIRRCLIFPHFCCVRSDSRPDDSDRDPVSLVCDTIPFNLSFTRLRYLRRVIGTLHRPGTYEADIGVGLQGMRRLRRGGSDDRSWRRSRAHDGVR